MWLKLHSGNVRVDYITCSYRGSDLDLAAGEFPIKRMDTNKGGKKDLPWWGEMVLGVFPTAFGIYSES